MDTKTKLLKASKEVVDDLIWDCLKNDFQSTFLDSIKNKKIELLAKIRQKFLNNLDIEK